MAKGYWINFFHSVSDPDKVEAYRKLAGPAMQAAGARFLVRGVPTKAYEAGLMQRVVMIEFDSVEQAIAVHDGPGYQAAVKALGFSQVRVRHHGEVARIEVDGAEIDRLVAEREQVVEAVRKAGYKFVSADLEGYATGSLNRTWQPSK